MNATPSSPKGSYGPPTAASSSADSPNPQPHNAQDELSRQPLRSVPGCLSTYRMRGRWVPDPGGHGHAGVVRNTFHRRLELGATSALPHKELFGVPGTA